MSSGWVVELFLSKKLIDRLGGREVDQGGRAAENRQGKKCLEDGAG